MKFTDEAIPSVILHSTCTLPGGGRKLKVANKHATFNQSVSSAKKRPGHILVAQVRVNSGNRGCAHLRPNPKEATFGSWTLGSSLLSLMNRSGLNDSGSG